MRLTYIYIYIYIYICMYKLVEKTLLCVRVCSRTCIVIVIDTLCLNTLNKCESTLESSCPHPILFHPHTSTHPHTNPHSRTHHIYLYLCACACQFLWMCLWMSLVGGGSGGNTRVTRAWKATSGSEELRTTLAVTSVEISREWANSSTQLSSFDKPYKPTAVESKRLNYVV